MMDMKENKMGVWPVNKLLVTMSIPMIISMLVQALYNVVDSMFVAQISENALTAVSLAFPYQNLMIAVAVGTGVGVNALLSRALGEKNHKAVKDIADHSVFLALMSWLVFAILGIVFCRNFFAMQTNVPEIVEGGTAYMRICSVISIGLFIQIAFEKLLASTGRTILTMYTQTAGALINIVLDPIFIFGLFGAPRLGIAGAAVATVIGQICGALLGILLNHKFNPEVQLSFHDFKLKMPVIRQIYSIGVPSILMSSIGSIMTFGMNKILIGFSTTAAAVFGVYFKLQSFVFMPVFGLNNGMVPILAYNFGAHKPKRIMDTIKLSLFYASLIMVIGFLIFQWMPATLLGIFNASETMLNIGVPALRIISTHFLLAGISIICSTVQQAFGHGVRSLLISLVRQLVVLLPVAYFLSIAHSLDMVWLAFPIAETVALIMGVAYLIQTYKKEIKPMETRSKEKIA
ncbi:MATE family efflux transporter [Dubosiella newyorkensis]|jgi:putative MATE family efflux protein|uniref:MATE family efflux transporter n=2 Tax=Dubosiella newyorkensis TaxID=1862672 RepID=UPI00235424C8|nr:MATE family efflux transporter [Dubosiella newyorkensis]MCI9041505.1 MATE family efflux transporter [Dubosiella newyorkensis]